MFFLFLSTAAGGGERESECFTTQGWMLETSLVFRDGFCKRDREKLLRISIFLSIKSDGLFKKGRATIAINRGTCHLTRILLVINHPYAHLFPG